MTKLALTPRAIQEIAEEYYCSFETALSQADKVLRKAVNEGDPQKYLEYAKEIIHIWWLEHMPTVELIPNLCQDEWSSFPISLDAALFKVMLLWQEKLLKAQHDEMFSALNVKGGNFDAAIHYLPTIPRDELLFPRKVN